MTYELKQSIGHFQVPYLLRRSYIRDKVYNPNNVMPIDLTQVNKPIKAFSRIESSPTVVEPAENFIVKGCHAECAATIAKRLRKNKSRLQGSSSLDDD